MMIQSGIGEGKPTGGCFITTSIFKIDDIGSGLLQDNLLGQIASLEQFGDAADALAVANETCYGLAV